MAHTQSSDDTSTPDPPKLPGKRKRQKPSPPPTPLPRLIMPLSHLPITEVEVNEQPTMEERNGLTWVVQNRPYDQLAKQQLIRLRTDAQRSGVGKLSQIVQMRRHWVTFSISGARETCTLRVPIPWVALDSFESMSHTTNYSSLPSIPRPHPSFRDLPPFRCDKENPYEFEVDEDELQDLDRRLRQIANTEGWS